MTRKFEAPRGMRDFYPDQADARNAIFDAWKRAAREFGFAQYDACVVESLDLLKHKSGPEIIEQVYAFQDKSGRQLALRPEMTPTLARMIAARRGSLSLPLKWFAIAQCFRYERASRGRKREHYQWNLDIVGEVSLSAEAEVIACAMRALTLLGFSPGEVVVHLSSRALISDLLSKSGIPAPRHQTVFRALDKKGKLENEAISQMLFDSDIDKQSVDAIFKIASISSIEEATAILDEMPQSARDVAELMRLLELYGVAGSVIFDISVVRGLEYYTGLVFEAFDAKKEFRAVFGGGRYDRLLEEMGGGNLTAVGLGFGDVVVAELLARKKNAALRGPKTAFAVGYMEESQQPDAIRIARCLRESGVGVDLALHAEKARSFFARVGDGRFERAIFIGPDDLSRGAVRVKNLLDRTETVEPLEKYIARP